MEEQYKKTFDQMVDSLKMYQRYELKDKNRKDILDKVYVDPIENDGILNLCLKDNTTVLIGRRGPGKSTIFMRMQNELRKQNDIMTCYIDVKSIFDVAKRNYITINYLKTSNLEEIEQYSIQRQFILDFVDELINEICKNYDTIWEKFKQKLHISKSQKAIDKLKNIRKRIQDNNHLSNIEMQTLQEVMHSNVDNMSYCDKRSMKMDISLSKKKNILNAGGNRENTLSEGEENGKKYNRVFARIFEITSIVTEIKSILQELSMRRLFLILDDYSEIEQTSLVMFCDLIVNTLHNNSDNFVKLKISAYPGRVELGELDRQKVDIRYLDYFQLYAGDKRNEMESMAVAYTERLMDTRLKIYTGKDFDYYFDTTKTSKEEYCKYLFNMTMNVVRHIGLILDYAQELSIIQGERITLNILNEASKRFYKERLVQFFEESKTAKMTYNERIESLELNKLLNQIIDKEKTIKTNIRTNQYTAVIFQKERNNPYTSHFYIAQELEPYLGSLELNFFISKYNEMSNKSGKKVSIYALNYGLCMDENLRWGKPKGNEYRTYFIESPFNFTPVIKNFLSENKKIYCENCMHEFSEEEYNLMKKYGGTCLKCGCKNSIQEKRVLSDEERSEIEEIEKKDNLLEREQYQLLKLLQYSRKDKTATELAQELDVSWQKIGWIAKKIEEDYCYLKKEPRKGKMYYVLSDLGREYLDSITP